MIRLALSLLVFTTLLQTAHGQDAKPVAVVDSGGHMSSVNKLVFTKDSERLISVSDDKSLRVWDMKTGESLKVIYPPRGPGFEGQLYAVALSPDQKTLAVSGYTRGIYLLSTTNWQLQRRFTGCGIIQSLAYSPDGNWLAAGSSDNNVYLWDTAGKTETLLQMHDKSVRCVAFSPDSAMLASVGNDSMGYLWTVKDAKKVAELRGHSNSIASVDWSPDGKTLATGGADTSIRLWSPDGKLLQTFDKEMLQGETINSVAFHPTKKELLYTTGSLRGGHPQIVTIDLNAKKESGSFFAYNTQRSAIYSPDGKRVASGGFSPNDFHVFDAKEGEILANLGSLGSSVWAVGWSTDGKSIGWGNYPRGGGQMFLNDFGDLSQLFSFEKQTLQAPTDDFVRGSLRNDEYQVGRTGQNTLGIRKNGAAQATVDTQSLGGMYRSACLVPPGRVALGLGSGRIGLYKLDSGELERTLLDHTGGVWGLAPSPNGKYLLSGSNDQTVKIWPLDQNQPLLSFFASVAGEWIAWTPEGYFAASPGGEKHLYWLVDNGPAQLPTVHAGSQFRKTLYRPDVIGNLLEAGSLEKALQKADAGKSKEIVKVADILPPIVVITTPDEPQVKVESDEVTIKVLARPVGTYALQSLRVLLDGRPVPDQAKTYSPAATGQVRESWKLKLPAGKSTVTVVAESAVSKSTSDPVEIIVDASRGLVRTDKKEPKLEDLPALYVLAIGVSEYPGHLKLSYAAKDAQILAKTLKATSDKLYRQVEVKLLVDKDATRRNILQGLTWLRKQMTQRDVAIVSFAGHGDKDGDGKFYLLPIDVDVDDLISTAVPGEQVKSILASVPGKVIMLLDACHAGAVDGTEKKRSRSGLADDLVRELVTDDYGVVVFCSAMGRESAIESAAVEHGYFTLAIVEGLQGKADYNKDGAIHLNELDLYVTNRVKDLSKGKQHPVTVRPASMRSFPLALANPVATSRLDPMRLLIVRRSLE